MTDRQNILARFDEELERLRRTYTSKSALAFFDRGAARQRNALDTYMRTHTELPATMFQLSLSGIANNHISTVDHHLRGSVAARMRNQADELAGPKAERPISEFLDRLEALTERELRRLPAASLPTVLSMYLIRAAYQRPSASWALVASEVLRSKGFSEQQIELLRTDKVVRKAVQIFNAIPSR